MKNYILLSLMAILFFSSCECEDLPIIEPQMVDPFIAQLVDGDGYIIISFNKQIDTSSVTLNSSLFLETTNPISVEFFFNAEQDEILFPKCAINCGFSQICELTVQLKSGTNGIVSTERQILDGDHDGTDGGDFEELISFPSCFDPGPSLLIESPVSGAEAFYSFSVFSPLSYVDLSYTFSEEVDISTVIEGETFYLTLGGVDFTSIFDFNWSSDHRTLYFSIELDDVLEYTSIEVTFVGTDQGDGVVKSIDGYVLDGDVDGFPGGNHSSSITYEIIPQVETPFSPPGTPSSTLLALDTLSGKFRMDIRFNKDMEQNTNISEAFVFTQLIYADEYNVPLSSDITWLNPRHLVLYTEEDATTFLNPPCCDFYLEIKPKNDNGVELIKDIHGNLLDGDYDEVFGGDYFTYYYYFL